MDEEKEKKTPEPENPKTEPDPTPETTPEPTPAPMPGEGGASEDKALSKNRWQELAERFSEGVEVSSEDEAFELISDELEDLTEWKREEKKVNEALIDALTAEPDMQQLIGYVLQGASFKEALARTIDIESLTPAEGDPDRAAWEKAKGERIERLKKMEEEDRAEEERMAERQTNLGNTKSLIASFSEKNKMTPEETRTLQEKLAQFTRDILDMKVDEGTLDMILKSMRMEKIIEEAREDGATGERNRKIETMRQKREEDTDGLPKLDAGAAAPENGEKSDELKDFFVPVFKKHRIE